MGTTVFYSWQSDRDQKTNRFFVRDALAQAIESINREVKVSDAERPADSGNLSIDHDTKDVPGTPDIVSTIFKKIDACGIFLADLTYVASSTKGDGLSNPNVLTERGYALKAIGPNRLIAVMNTAYGKVDDLPFDFRHARHPMTYHLEAGASSAERRRQTEALVMQFATAILCA